MRLRIEVDVEMPDSAPAQRFVEPMRVALSDAGGVRSSDVEISAVRVTAVDLERDVTAPGVRGCWACSGGVCITPEVCGRLREGR